MKEKATHKEKKIIEGELEIDEKIKKVIKSNPVIFKAYILIYNEHRDLVYSNYKEYHYNEINKRMKLDVDYSFTLLFKYRDIGKIIYHYGFVTEINAKGKYIKVQEFYAKIEGGKELMDHNIRYIPYY